MKELRLIVFFVLAFLSVQAQNCPSSIAVTAPSAEVVTGKIFQFSVAVNGLGANISITYNWTISSGIIVTGQGTSVITVDPGNEPGYCTASVEIGGLSPQCRNTASSSAEIIMGPEKIITTNTVTTGGINEAVNKFISKTGFNNNNIKHDALVNIYANNARQFIQLKAIVEKAFEVNGIFSYQNKYKIVDAGINKVAAVEFFLIKNMF